MGRVFILFFSILIGGSVSAYAGTDLAIIRANLTDQIYSAIPSSTRADFNVQNIALWKSKQMIDGSFTDVDYLNTQGSTWGPTTSLARALTMIEATTLPENPLFQDSATEASALKAIQFIARGSFWNFNWWTREIALPLTTYKILLLFDAKLDTVSRQYLMQSTYQGHLIDHPSGWPAEGQNLVWYSEITIALGVLFNRSDWVTETVAALSNELKLGSFQGIQEDYSFHQHGDLFYSGGYGLSFSSDVSRMFQILGGTSLTFSEDNYQNLSHYILEGQRYLVHGKTLDVSSMGRYYPRVDGAATDPLQVTCARMALLPGSRQADFKSCADTLALKTQNGVNGTKYFGKSDFLAHNRNGFGISLRMNSKRTMNADSSPLGEGLRSEYLSDGLTYIYRSGEEYWNIYPIWNYRHLPGTTEEFDTTYPDVPNNNYIPHFGTQDFVGGMSDQSGGFAAFDFARDQLSAKKSWFFFEDGMIALGAGIQCANCKPVHTTLNQEWSTGDIQYGLRSTFGSAASLQNGAFSSPDLAWAYANDVGYLFLEPASATLQNETQSGSLSLIAALLSPATLTGKISTLWMDHSAPGQDHYAYAVLPHRKPQALLQTLLAPNFLVLSNTAAIQAVEFPAQGIVQLVFFGAGKLSFDQGASFVETDSAALIQLKQDGNGVHLSISTPLSTVPAPHVRYQWRESFQK
jgi:chondroitin AC lyase